MEIDRFHPLVVKHGEKFALTNANGLVSLNSAQKAAVGVLVWDQVKFLMEANGEPTASTRNVAHRAAEASLSSPSSVDRLHTAVERKPELLNQVLSGELLVIEALRQAGLKTRLRMAEGGKSTASNPAYLGKGDKFDLASEAILRYLRAWEKVGFEFPHVNPREAKRRLKRIDEVLEGLKKTRDDLESRSHPATSRAPHERRENGKS